MKIELVIGIDPGLIQTGIYYQNADGLSAHYGLVNGYNYSVGQYVGDVFDRLVSRISRIKLDGQERVVVGIECPSHRDPNNKVARRMAWKWDQWVEEKLPSAAIVYFIRPRDWQDELPPETNDSYISGLRRGTLVDARKARSIEHFNCRPGQAKKCLQDDISDAFGIYECAWRRFLRTSPW